MREALSDLSEKQISFICEECSITEEKLLSMNDDELYDIVYEKMCDIEIDEVCGKDGEDDTERGELASDIVTLLGNTLEREN